MSNSVLLLASLVGLSGLTRLVGDLVRQVVLPYLRERLNLGSHKRPGITITLKAPNGGVTEISVPNSGRTPLSEQEIKRVIKFLSETDNGRTETETHKD